LNKPPRQFARPPVICNSYFACGFNPLISSPDEFGAFYLAETAKWGKIAPVIGIIGD